MTKAGAKNLNDLSSFRVTGSAGDVIFTEGEEAAAAFIIEDGRVELVRESAGSPRLATLSRGDIFGESALFGGGTREASARALTDYQALRLDRATFDEIVGADPAIGVHLARRLAGYLRNHRVAVAERRQTGTRRAVTAAHVSRSQRPTQPTLIVSAMNLRIPLEARELTVGRFDKAAGTSPDIDLTAADGERSLSRKHARLRFREGRYYVCEEEGARNGTFVNGRRVSGGREVELTDGVKVRFGLVDTVFVTPG